MNLKLINCREGVNISKNMNKTWILISIIDSENLIHLGA